MTASTAPKIAQIVCGDSAEILKTMPSEFLHCAITSPPYFHLRDYGVAEQIGWEVDVDAYIDRLLAVFCEVWRILRPDGTCWINIDDTYQNKRLLLIPQRLVIALEAAGWIVRADLIWRKPTIFPFGSKDRPLRDHEYLFMLSKSRRYHFDRYAIRERTGNEASWEEYGERKLKKQFTKIQHRFERGISRFGNAPGRTTHPLGRARRTVLTISTARSRDKHYATFPDELPRICIMAGCPADGIVLDPFCGIGTTCRVARDLGRHYIGIDLNPDYVALANELLAANNNVASLPTAS